MISDPRLAGQWVVSVSADNEFHAEGTVKLETLTRASLSGTVTTRPEGPTLQGTQDGRPAPLPVCESQTQISAPIGHFVVLGATPTNTMTSAFVVQILVK